MQYSRFFLCLSLVSVAYTSTGQVSTEQRIQQLKYSWYQNLQKLEELGNLITEKNASLENLLIDTMSILAKYGIKRESKYGLFGNRKKMLDDLALQFKNAADEFNKRFLHAIQDEVNVKNFIIQELCVRKDFLPAEEMEQVIDNIKFNLIQTVIDINEIKKLLDDYEDLFQKMVEIDKELVTLGSPRLLQN